MLNNKDIQKMKTEIDDLGKQLFELYCEPENLETPPFIDKIKEKQRRIARLIKKRADKRKRLQELYFLKSA